MSEQDDPPQKMYNRIEQWEDQSQKKKDKFGQIWSMRKKKLDANKYNKEIFVEIFLSNQEKIYSFNLNRHIVTKYYMSQHTHTHKRIQNL